MQIQLLDGREFSPSEAINVDNIDSLLSSKSHSIEEFTNIAALRPIIKSDNTARALELKKPIGQILKLGNETK